MFKKILLVMIVTIPMMSRALDPNLQEEVRSVQSLINKLKAISEQRKKLRFWQKKEKEVLGRQIDQMIDEITNREVGLEGYLDY
jgi:predicted metal-dependent TIM-barrel fold hydrolase